MYDLIIKNGKILDGTGNPYYRADIAVKDGKIARIGKHLEGDCRVIDATGLTVTPGFIDSHSHADRDVLAYPTLVETAEQGITTVVAGQCGSSDPVAQQLDSFTDTPLGSNLASLVGHGTLRKAVIGSENRAPTEKELEQMKQLLTEAMEHGATGISFGLIYAPGCHADTQELVELASIVANYHGVAAIHLRNESDTLVEAVQEFISIVRASGVRGVLSHHKATRPRNWGKVKTTLQLLDEVNEEGLELYCDVYPYSASSTSLSSAFLPRQYRTGTENTLAALANEADREAIRQHLLSIYDEDFSWVLITRCKKHPEYVEKRVSEIAEMRNATHIDAMLDILRESELSCNACFFSMCEEDIETVMAHPRAMICTDSGVAKGATVYHPRLRGSFPRVLGRYVRERKVTSLAEMIRKMTSLPATVYGLKGKGLLLEGYDADLCIFDADTILDHSEFTDCTPKADGLHYVIVNGQIAAEDAVHTGVRAGKFLPKQH